MGQGRMRLYLQGGETSYAESACCYRKGQQRSSSAQKDWQEASLIVVGVLMLDRLL